MRDRDVGYCCGRRSIYHHLRPADAEQRISVRVACNGVYCAGDQPGELSGTAEWDEYTEGAKEGEEVVRCHRVEGSVVPGVYSQQLLLLSGLHHAILLHPNISTGSSWGFTIVRALHPGHVDCWIVLRTSAQWISGTEAGTVLATASS